MQFPLGRAVPATHTSKAGRSRGFTLIELMVTLVVLAVVMGIAAPSFSDMINRNRLTAAANELVSALQVARMEAIRRNARVMLCPSTDGSACAGSDWSRLIVFVDANGNSAPGDTGDEIVRNVQISESGITVAGSSNVATNQRLGFGADGFARVGNAGAKEGALSACSSKVPVAENTRDVVVEVSRINVATRNGTSSCSALPD